MLINRSFLLVTCGVLSVGRGLRQVHVQDLVVKEHLVSCVGEDLGDFFSVFDLSDVEIGLVE